MRGWGGGVGDGRAAVWPRRGAGPAPDGRAGTRIPLAVSLPAAAAISAALWAAIACAVRALL